MEACVAASCKMLTVVEVIIKRNLKRHWLHDHLSQIIRSEILTVHVYFKKS